MVLREKSTVAMLISKLKKSQIITKTCESDFTKRPLIYLFGKLVGSVIGKTEGVLEGKVGLIKNLQNMKFDFLLPITTTF